MLSVAPSRKDVQISERERDVAQAHHDKERAMREGRVAEDRLDAQTQRDRELKKVASMVRKPRSSKADTQLRTRAEIKGPSRTRWPHGVQLDVSSARCARLSPFQLSVKCVNSFLVC